MNILLWVLQVLLAVVNVLHGWLYLTWSPARDEQLRQRHPGGQPLGLSPGFRNFIGVSELLAGVGLILPGITGILPWLTPLAAAGFTIVMAGAAVHHGSRGEPSSAMITGVIGVLAALVAYMRWRIAPL